MYFIRVVGLLQWYEKRLKAKKPGYDNSTYRDDKGMKALTRPVAGGIKEK